MCFRDVHLCTVLRMADGVALLIDCFNYKPPDQPCLLSSPWHRNSKLSCVLVLDLESVTPQFLVLSTSASCCFTISFTDTSLLFYETGSDVSQDTLELTKLTLNSVCVQR